MIKGKTFEISKIKAAKSKILTIKKLPYSDSGEKHDEEIVLRPLKYIQQVSGKQVRTNLMYGFNLWMKIPNETLRIIMENIERLHETSLILDDIEDNATSRRGIPAVHCIYGIPFVTNSACFIMSIITEHILKMNSIEVFKIYCKQILDAHRGQGLDIYWRDNFICPSVEEYKRMVILKTGCLFKLAIDFMQVFSENKTNFNKLIDLFSVYFQIRDDYCNIVAEEYTKSKGYFEDLTEGKFSFPIIHAIQNNPNDKELTDLLRGRPTDIETKKYYVSLLEKYGSLDYTYQVLLKYQEDFKRELDSFGENQIIGKIFNDILYI